MRLFYLVILLTILLTKVVAQDVYKTGYVVKSNGDTLRGSISNIYSSKEIKFRKDKKDKPVLLMPSQISAYSTEGNVFYSKVVSITNYKAVKTLMGGGSIEETFLLKDDHAGIIKDTVFLQKLIDGKVSLYRMSYLSGLKYFYVENSFQLVEIPQKYYDFKLDALSAEFLKTLPIEQVQLSLGKYYRQLDYLKVLMVAFEDDNYFKEATPFVYSEKNIINAVADYNKDRGIKRGGKIYKTNLKRIYVGGNIGMLKVKKDDYINLFHLKSTASYDVYAMIPVYGINRSTFIKLGYCHYSYESDVRERSIRKAYLGFRYQLMDYMVKPYLGFNFSYGKQYLNEIKSTNTISAIFEYGLIVSIKRVHLVLNGGVTPFNFREHGYKLNSFSVGVLL
ncbi:hypothetical protein [Emticicia sp. BO119]|uniref:hypothetical protein n=1 Tax=Emticicia sp. BO119 TaxID=2757768 RepID=UPI0015F10041|nr:hypothetical protein [Emticicia sp. BO119]MBA4851284.1 hypothetical protein [Emticicia sp. BO119]